ncbi:MAG: hypothetical protein DRO43_03720 [Candidatus Hecatellales archaeon]|nr:MAG: hypothetical protein DRO43_03720 [Candidatus Hecatellales archaeon]
MKLHSYYANIKDSWILADLVHIPTFMIPFLLICYITGGNLKEYGFNLNEEKFFTHKRMVTVGVFFGILLSLRYILQIAWHTPLVIPHTVTVLNIVGNMTFQWIIVGISEETMFRGLIQTYLRTGSLLTTIIIHNTIFGTHLTIGYAIYWILGS